MAKEINHIAPRLPKHLSTQPDIAWPTIILACCNLIIYFTIQYLLWNGLIDYYIAVALLSICVYINFAPMHDSMHNAIASHKSGYLIINQIMGRLTQIPLVTSFIALKFLHLQHHKYTNISGNYNSSRDKFKYNKIDPDSWSGVGPWYLLPIRWFTQPHRYLYIYFNNIMNRPLYERIEVLCTFSIIYGITGYYSYILNDSRIYYNFHIPAVITIPFLAFVFSYIPHRPHKSDNIYVQTSVTKWNSNNNYGNSWCDFVINVIMMNQNYHNIHHLYPFLPFYSYPKVWHQVKQELIDNGAAIVPLWPIFISQFQPNLKSA